MLHTYANVLECLKKSQESQLLLRISQWLVGSTGSGMGRTLQGFSCVTRFEMLGAWLLLSLLYSFLRVSAPLRQGIYCGPTLMKP